MTLAWEEALLIFLTMVELTLSKESEDVSLMFLTIVELDVVRLCQVVVHFSLEDC